MGKKKRASFNPENLSTSSGLLDDTKARFTECHFGMFDYGGAAPEVPAFISKLMSTEDEQVADQVWTVGGTPQDWEIADDGESLVPISKKAEKGINVKSNFGLLLISLADSGFPTDTLDDMDASDFDGMEAHVIRVESKMDKTKETVKVDEIITLPGGEAKDTKKAEAEEEDAPSAEDAAIEFVNAVLKDKKSETPGEVTKKDIPKLAFAEFKDDPGLCNTVMTLLFEDEFLKANWKLKSGVITAK